MKFQDEFCSFSFHEASSLKLSRSYKVQCVDVNRKALQPRRPTTYKGKGGSSCSYTPSSVSSDEFSTTSSNDSSSCSFTPRRLLILKRKAASGIYVCSFCIARKTRRTTIHKEIAGFNSFSGHMIDFHSTLVLVTGTSASTSIQNVAWSQVTDSVLKPARLNFNEISNVSTTSSSSFLHSPFQNANTQTEDEDEAKDNLQLPSPIDQQIKEIHPDIDEWFQNIEIPDSKECKDASIQTEPMTLCICGRPYLQNESKHPYPQ